MSMPGVAHDGVEQLTHGFAAAFDADGFYRTGDLFEIAGADGRYYRFVGRRKDTIVRGGMNISPEEVDALLMTHPKIAEAASFAMPDDVLKRKIAAFNSAK